jgi:hypothetical protein
MNLYHTMVSHVYITEVGGLDLLHMIYKEKEMAMVDSEDIVITIE